MNLTKAQFGYLQWIGREGGTATLERGAVVCGGCKSSNASAISFLNLVGQRGAGRERRQARHHRLRPEAAHAMICPECNKTMSPVPCQTPINYAAEIQWQKWRCEPCKLIAKVETIFSHDDSTDAVQTESR